jgi:hypothetical protein
MKFLKDKQIVLNIVFIILNASPKLGALTIIREIHKSVNVTGSSFKYPFVSKSIIPFNVNLYRNNRTGEIIHRPNYSKERIPKSL